MDRWQEKPISSVFESTTQRVGIRLTHVHIWSTQVERILKVLLDQTGLKSIIEKVQSKDKLLYSSKSHKKLSTQSLLNKSHRNKKLCLWLLLNNSFFNNFLWLLDEYNNGFARRICRIFVLKYISPFITLGSILKTLHFEEINQIMHSRFKNCSIQHWNFTCPIASLSGKG